MEAHNAVIIQSPVLYPTGTDMDSDAAWMGALPFGTSIVKELSSTVELGGYSWSSGTVVSGEGPQIPEMGDHESILVGSGFSQTPGFILPRGDVSIPLPVHNPKENILGKEGYWHCNFLFLSPEKEHRIFLLLVLGTFISIFPIRIIHVQGPFVS
jgi:hypothetical protein